MGPFPSPAFLKTGVERHSRPIGRAIARQCRLRGLYIATALMLAAGAAFAQTPAPDHVLGTSDGEYRLYTPGEMVRAGAAEAAPTYRFFSHTAIAAQAQTSGNLPHTFTLLAPTLFEKGLQTGPFHTQYEGSIGFLFSTGAASLTLTVSTKHTFANGKTLTSKRSDTERAASSGSVYALAQFSSVTVLAKGPVTFDDGTTGEITDAFLAQPVTVGINLQVVSSATETMSDVQFSPDAGLTMYQLRDPILGAGGGGGPALANNVPGVTVLGATGQAGQSLEASRGDHSHAINIPATPNVQGGDSYLRGRGGGAPTWHTGTLPPLVSTGTAGECLKVASGATVLEYSDCGGGGSATPLSDATPKALGTAAAGTATAASRGDHVHKRPTEIADNTAAIATQAAEDVRLKAGIVSLENDLYRPSGAIATGDVLTAVQCSGSPVANCQSEWKAPTGGGDGVELSDATPKDVGTAAAGTGTKASRDDHVHGGGGGAGLPSFAGAGKHLATNADDDAAVWVTPPPDLSADLAEAEAEIAANDDDIEALDFLTQDLIGGTPSTGWATVTDVTNAGIAVFNGAPSCNAARGATYQTAITSGVGGKYSAVRIKAGFAVANARVEVKGEGLTYEDLISGWSLLCTSSDGNFAYYHELYGDTVLAWGTGVASLAMQTTGGAHIGTSKYAGDPLKVERWGIVGDATHIPIGKMLPAITGQGGNCLKVNSGATGTEWAACGGSSGGGGGAAWEKIKEVAITNAELRKCGTTGGTVCSFGAFSDGEKATILSLIKAGTAFGVYIELIRNSGRLQTLSDGPSGVAFFKAQADTTAWDLSIPMESDINGLGDEWLCDLSSSNGWRCRTDGGSNYNAEISAIGHLYYLQAGGGGGTSDNPTIPDPTAAGALQHLRVNAAGGAYELASPYSTAAPKPPGTAAVGTALTLARSDHVHALPAIPQGSTDTPEADSANGAAGSSNKWSPSDHSHPITDHDTVTWTNALVSTLTGGGASGGVTCDGSAGAPTAASCKGLTDAFRRGDYNFFLLRVARFDDNQSSEPLHVSGCPLYPGIPSAIFAGDVVAETACTANSAKNSSNAFSQYDVFVKFGNTGNFIQVRLPNYNSHGVDNATVTLTGVR